MMSNEQMGDIITVIEVNPIKKHCRTCSLTGVKDVDCPSNRYGNEIRKYKAVRRDVIKEFHDIRPKKYIPKIDPNTLDRWFK